LKSRGKFKPIYSKIVQSLPHHTAQWAKNAARAAAKPTRAPDVPSDRAPLLDLTAPAGEADPDPEGALELVEAVEEAVEDALDDGLAALLAFWMTSIGTL